MAGIVLLLLVCLNVYSVSSLNIPATVASTFSSEYDVLWGAVQIEGDGTIALTLDQNTGSGYASKNMYTFGYVSTKIKLVGGNSAGTVTAYFLSSSKGNVDLPDHDELDFEFLGNVSGEPYILQTNVFANGIGAREQRIYLWFDPTADYHTYSVLWNRQIIIFAVDETPIRIFRNNMHLGVDFPLSKPMGIYSSLWNGDGWATQGGVVKIDWSSAPFMASYKDFTIDACLNTDGAGACANAEGWWSAASFEDLDSTSQQDLLRVKQNYLVYDYCTDHPRYPIAPPECATN